MNEKELIEHIENLITNYEIKDKEGFVNTFINYINSLEGTFDLDEKKDEYYQMITLYSTIPIEKAIEKAKEEIKRLENG